jgi:hypothetical protein
MCTSRSVSLLFALLFGVGLVGGCEQPSTSDVNQTEEGVVRLGSVEAVDSVSRAVAPNDRPLVVDGFRGTVNLSGSDRETAQLTFVRRARAENAESARGILEDVTVEESGGEQTYTYTLDAGGETYALVDVSGTVPRQTPLRVKEMNGAVSISGMSEALTVTHQHGPITIREAASSVEVETKNGDVTVTMRDVPADATVTLRTKNGDVTLRLPSDASAQLKAETSAGIIRTQGLSPSGEQFMPEDAGGEYTARLGTGDASVTLHTENGSVLIQSIEAASDTTGEGPDQETLGPPPSDTTVTAPSDPDTMRDAQETRQDTVREGPDTTTAGDSTMFDPTG